MTINIKDEGSMKIATLSGRLDTAASAQFSKDIEPLIENADKTIVMDCEQLAFISSSGLRLFLTLRKATMAKGGKVIVRNISPDIQQVFTITGFTSLFEFE